MATQIKISENKTNSILIPNTDNGTSLPANETIGKNSNKHKRKKMILFFIKENLIKQVYG